MQLRRFTNAHHRVEFANANAREMAATCLKLVADKAEEVEGGCL